MGSAGGIIQSCVVTNYLMDVMLAWMPLCFMRNLDARGVFLFSGSDSLQVPKPSWVYGALSLHGFRHSCSAAGNTCEELWRSTCRFSPELPAGALFAC